MGFMGKLRRRDFLKASAGLVGGGLLGKLAFGESEKSSASSTSWNGFKYAMCNESMKGQSWEQQCRVIADAGYRGVEIAAFTLVEEGVEEITAAKRKEMVSMMQKAGIECAGLHWLLAPPPKGLHFTTPEKSVRKKTVEYFSRLIDFCSDLGGDVMIFGSPKQRNAVGISVEEAKKYFAEGMAAVADHSQRRDIKILIEPLDTSQTDVVNTLAEALAIVKEVDHPAIELMFDFHNTPNETEPFDVLIKKYCKHIFHVHVQEMDGRHLGTGTAVNDYVKAFQTLKDLGYDKWVSLEVFDFSPGGKKIAEESMKVLKEIERELV
jgi:sugar phosphate isomerase/epimerase